MDDSADSDFVEAEIIPEHTDRTNRKSPSRLALIALGVIAVVGLGAMVIVTSMQEDADKAAERVRDHPVVIEQLGGIEQCSYNWGASLSEGGKRTDVFDVHGPKGSGQLVTFELFYDFRSIVLRTEAGEWELLDEATAADDEEHEG